MEKKMNKKVLAIIITIVIILLITAIVVGFLITKNTNDSTGTVWGDTYYAYLKSVKEADEEKLQTIGLSKDVQTAKIQFVQIKNEEKPEMVLTYQKGNENYTNIYYIENEEKVNVITYNNPTVLKLLYNREAKEYMWYLNSKENDENSYKSLEKILANSQETEADYTFKDSELESKMEVTEGEIPEISKFDEKFIEIELDKNNVSEINFNEKDQELKQEVTKTVQDYKSKENIITEEIKTNTEEKEEILKNKEEEIKVLEENKKKEEEEASKKAAEEAAKAAQTAKLGKYTLEEEAVDGTLTIKNITDTSVQFEIGVVNLFGGYHMGELSATATKIGDNKYMYKTVEYGKNYEFYMEMNGNRIKVSTSKMLKGDGFDPFCGANATFDGTYIK